MPNASRGFWRCVLRLVVGLAAGSCVCALADAPQESRALCQRALSTLFKGSQPTVLVVLSPRMPLALQEWRRMQVTAEDDGFQVLAMRDPRIPDGEWAQALTKVASDGLTDIGLIAQTTAADCGLLNHTPSALVGRCGAVHPWPILGVMPSDFWADTLRSRLGQLAGEGCK